jgi:hypothetical protein
VVLQLSERNLFSLAQSGLSADRLRKQALFCLGLSKQPLFIQVNDNCQKSLACDFLLA